MPKLTSLKLHPRVIATSLAATLVLACAKDNDLLDVPSQMAEAPAPGNEMALDSTRIAARKLVRSDHLPGVSIAVGRGSKVIYSEAFGWSDLSSETLATPTTLYPVGSISKSMTATAAGLLYERGKLDFNVPIQKYLPDFPPKRWPITTAQLMGHIAGVIRSGGMGEALRRAPCPNARAAAADAVKDTLQFEPGAEWRYSNYGYQLVGAVVEAAAGEPYLAFMDREVFKPAGMNQTVPDLADEGGEAVKYDRAAYGTLRRGQDIDMSCPMAAGGFLSTPSELVKFGFAMLNHTILDSATVNLFWTPQRLKSGAPTTYGYGWSVRNVSLGAKNEGANTRMISHGGAVLGGQASLLIFPDEDLVVAVMINGSGEVSDLSLDIARFFRGTNR